ncbi:hypothetical protein [Planobispora longispora]|uniref:Uncharacterized protein n=1 Tax=Planobispora longispora TaxID=28887 RepID=A0A8J3RVE9_9ACTN|nr:hypothetical protein [Planobispora longispora]GIH80856.1 hypothetical protein Plo01_72850 [Planobispora longispora]
MADEPAGDRRARLRRLRLRADGQLYDLDEHRCVGLEELCDDVRFGRSFRAWRQHTGAPCTNEVLVAVLRMTLPRDVRTASEAAFRVPEQEPQAGSDRAGRTPRG